MSLLVNAVVFTTERTVVCPYCKAVLRPKNKRMPIWVNLIIVLVCGYILPELYFRFVDDNILLPALILLALLIIGTPVICYQEIKRMRYDDN